MELYFWDFNFLPFFYHLPVKSLIFTNLPVNLKAGKSSTLPGTTTTLSLKKWFETFQEYNPLE